MQKLGCYDENRKQECLSTAKTTEDPLLTMDECIAEYTNQILEDDYYNVVNWANWKGIKIPVKLRNVIDSTF